MGLLWGLAGLGNAQLIKHSLAIAGRRGSEVGMEDSDWYDPDRARLATNADVLRSIQNLVQANERRAMIPSDLRKLLDLHSGGGAHRRVLARRCGPCSREGSVCTGMMATPTD